MFLFLSRFYISHSTDQWTNGREFYSRFMYLTSLSNKKKVFVISYLSLRFIIIPVSWWWDGCHAPLVSSLFPASVGQHAQESWVGTHWDNLSLLLGKEANELENSNQILKTYFLFSWSLVVWWRLFSEWIPPDVLYPEHLMMMSHRKNMKSYCQILVQIKKTWQKICLKLRIFCLSKKVCI